MKNLLILLVLIGSFSCKKEQDLNKVDETIYVRHQGADMPVYLRGNFSSNIIILIVHGGPGGNGLEYRTGPWTVELEEKYGMAYWDQRGQGMSQGNYDNSKLTISQMADDMDAVIKTLKFKYGKDAEVVALGHSWGGTLTAKYMVTGNLQQNLLGWIEADGAHDIPKNDIESIKLYREVSAQQIAMGNNVANWQEIKDWADAVDTNNITDEQSGEINANGNKVEGWLTEDGVLKTPPSGGNSGASLLSPINPLTSMLNGNLTNSALSSEIQQFSVTDELYKVTIPVLAVTGKYDFIVAPALAFDTYNLSSSAFKRIVVFDKSGHSPMSNEPSKFTSEVISFIEAIR